MIFSLEKYCSPETELLLICARAKLSPEKSTRLKELLQKNINWEYLISTARINKLIPLLYWHLNSISTEAIPKLYAGYLKDYFHKVTLSNLYLSKELCKVLKLFEAHDIPAIPYKGPVLASSIYNNLALREFSDLDILIQKEDFLKIKNLLLSQDYYPDTEYEMTPVQEQAWLEYYCDYSFDRNDSVHLELHWDILNKYFSIPFNVNQLWERSGKTPLGNETVPNLSPEDLLLILCIHGAKNCWDTLGNICDISELIKVRKDLDWETVIKHSNILGVKKMLFLGLYLANTLLEANLPQEILHKIKTVQEIKDLFPKILERLFGPPKVEPSPLEVSIFQFKVREHLLNKIKYFLLYLLTPTLGDWKFILLPRYLFFLYYFIRPFRLTGKYVFGLFGGKILSRFEITPPEVIDKMLELAEVNSKDIVYDLGCGNGQVLIRAAKNYGTHGVGIDIDPKRISESRNNARKEEVDHLLRFLHQDAMTADFSNATVVTFFLTFSVSPKIGLLFKKQLKAGTRIVSHCSYIREWTPKKTKIVKDNTGRIHTLYLWEIEKEHASILNKNADALQTTSLVSKS